MLQRILPSEVEPGMFIVGFGGGWFDHPFWRRRFKAESLADVERIRACNVPWVLIDTSRGIAPAQPSEEPGARTYSADQRESRRARKRALYKPAFTSPAQRSAKAMVSRTGVKIRGVFDQLELGWRVDTNVIDAVFDDIEKEVEDNAEALLTVVGLKTKDDYTYLHSVAVCALMVCIARHKGMPSDQVRDLGMAGLLHDIGKIRVADEILKKPGKLTDEEYKSAQCHAQFGFDLLKEVPDIPETALDVCLHHHEKIDGTGYPFGLAGDAISYAARLGAVCDVYDALTSNRAYKEPWSRKKALGAMWSWNGHFDLTVIADLMQVVHVYPEGLLVRLANGNLAMTADIEAPDEIASCIEFYSIHDKAWITPVSTKIARNDPSRAILGLEEPAQWGLEHWQDVQLQLKDAMKVGGEADHLRSETQTA